MNDRAISTTTTAVAAFVLWIIGGAFVVVGYFFALWFTGVGLYLTLLGGFLWVRRMLCRKEARERALIELGRDVERLRSV